MGLSKRASRKLVVYGCTYRWAVAPDDGYAVVVVERADGAGQRLGAYCQPYPGGAGAVSPASERDAHRTIGPQSVCRLVAAALELGWQPGTGHGVFTLRDADRYLWPAGP